MMFMVSSLVGSRRVALGWGALARRPLEPAAITPLLRNPRAEAFEHFRQIIVLTVDGGHDLIHGRSRSLGDEALVAALVLAADLLRHPLYTVERYPDVARCLLHVVNLSEIFAALVSPRMNSTSTTSPSESSVQCLIIQSWATGYVRSPTP